MSPNRVRRVMHKYGIAARLIERLPMSTTAAELDRFETHAVPTADSRASPFSVYLAFLEALIVGVIASGLLW